MRGAAVLLLPIVTGLNGIVWAEVVARSGAAAATAAGAVAYIVVVAGALVIGGLPASIFAGSPFSPR